MTATTYSTAAAAKRLGRRPAETLLLLRAFKVSHTRLGQQGAYLWDAAEVDRLLSTIGGNLGQEAVTVDAGEGRRATA